MRAIAEHAHTLGMRVHMDGARLANAAAALGVGLGAMTTGTGDRHAVPRRHQERHDVRRGHRGADPEGPAESMKYLRKMNMQLASKMRFISAQLLALYGGDLWLRSASHANAMAARLAAAVEATDGVELVYPTESNGVFADAAQRRGRPAARALPLLRLGPGRRRGALDVLLRHHRGRRRCVRRRTRARNLPQRRVIPACRRRAARWPAPRRAAGITAAATL